jgi:ABC-type phosphate transport system permease subunit
MNEYPILWIFFIACPVAIFAGIYHGEYKHIWYPVLLWTVSGVGLLALWHERA